jgi:hypothetical protein
MIRQLHCLIFGHLWGWRSNRRELKPDLSYSGIERVCARCGRTGLLDGTERIEVLGEVR